MSETASSDADLIAAHLSGDRQAFSELFRRHRDRLWSVALRTMRDPEEAADALQDAMISAFRNAGSFRSESRVTTWLHRIVVNACLDRIRRRQARATVPLPEDGPGEPAHPHDRIAEHDTRMVVSDALGELPEINEPLSCSWTSRDIRFRKRRDCSAWPRAPSRAAVPEAGSSWRNFSGIYGTRVRTRTSQTKAWPRVDGRDDEWRGSACR